MGLNEIGSRRVVAKLMLSLKLHYKTVGLILELEMDAQCMYLQSIYVDQGHMLWIGGHALWIGGCALCMDCRW